jgi:hypothetical protein
VICSCSGTELQRNRRMIQCQHQNSKLLLLNLDLKINSFFSFRSCIRIFFLSLNTHWKMSVPAHGYMCPRRCEWDGIRVLLPLRQRRTRWRTPRRNPRHRPVRPRTSVHPGARHSGRRTLAATARDGEEAETGGTGGEEPWTGDVGPCTERRFSKSTEAGGMVGDARSRRRGVREYGRRLYGRNCCCGGA